MEPCCDSVLFKDYHLRLFSFYQKGWRGVPTPKKMAEAGMYYTGSIDAVRCTYCKTIFQMWREGDDPDIEHARLSPRCLYAKWKLIPAVARLLEKIDGVEVEDLLKAYESLAQSTCADELEKHLSYVTVSDRTDFKCKVCLDKNSNVVFLGCRHLVTCVDCGYRLNTCPVCRQVVEAAFPVFT